MGFSALGIFTGADYETILIPVLENKLKTNLKIRLLYQIENKFNGFDLEAMLDEPKMGMKDLSAWNRIVLFPIMRR